MPKPGDKFITTLQDAHLEWGLCRHKPSRTLIYGEGYLQIPADVAYTFGILNSNASSGSAEYDFTTADGFITNGKLLASGNQGKVEYAKQFHGKGNLKALGDWYYHIGAKPGDQIEIEFTSATEILLTKLP